MSAILLLAVLLGSADLDRSGPTGNLIRSDSAFVVSTHMFAFHSRFILNLHDFLYMRGGMDTAPVDTSACYLALPKATRSGWEHANVFYRNEMSHRHHRTDSLMATLRYRLGEVEGGPPGVDLTEVIHVLDGARAAYRTCWWPDHDARNRSWIEAAVARLNQREDTLTALIEAYLPESWASTPIHVDVVTYASWAGANTVVDPVHIMMSSANPKYQGDYALEMLFHEASHDILHNGHLREVIDEPPRNLWHAILFYTVGESTRRVLATAGKDYTAYMFANGVLGSFHEALRKHWTPYLDGDSTWEEAVRSTANAL